MISTFIDLHVIAEKSNIKKPTEPKELFIENFVLHNLLRQISVYINGTLVSTSNNLSNYAGYIQSILMSPMSYKLLRGMAIGYE